MRAVTAADTERVRRECGADAARALVLFAAKEREARPFLPALVDAVRDMPDVHLVIKPHPAETPDVYATAIAGAANIHVAPAGAALPPLLAAASAVVTVNSTVAIDALSFGAALAGHRPAQQPVAVCRGRAGCSARDRRRKSGAALAKVLYDQEFRSSVHSRAVHPAHNDGQAASRSAEAILALARSGKT